jgi:hypothetical protein
MLARLPQPHRDRLAAGWGFLRTVPRLLQPADLADALAWAGNAVAGRVVFLADGEVAGDVPAPGIDAIAEQLAHLGRRQPERQPKW